jgi:hypothetical protein
MKLSDLLPLHNLYHKKYHLLVDAGKKSLNETNITILSLVRNLDTKLSNNINTLLKFFSLHNSNTNMVFFENDSIDNTKKILNDFKIKHPNNIHIISEDNGKKQFGSVKSEERLKSLSEYRNRAKDYAKDLKSDFVIVLDMDFDEISLDGLLNSFGWLATEPNISGVAGNSFEYKKGLAPHDPNLYNLWNYDSWAFRQNWWLDFHNVQPCPTNTVDPMVWFGLWIPPTGSSPITVNSAFGGSCIYRSSIYFNGQYDYKDCEHVCFHYSLYSNPSNNFRLVLNPSQQMVF